MTSEEHRIVEDFVREMERWLCGWCESSLKSVAGDSCKRCKRRAGKYQRVMELLEKPTSEEGFIRFWEAYPRKAGKRDAEKAWRQTSGERPPAQEIVDKLRELVGTPQWEDTRFIPYPATWLRRGGWADEPEAMGSDNGGPPGREPPEEPQEQSKYRICQECEDLVPRDEEHECREARA